MNLLHTKNSREGNANNIKLARPKNYLDLEKNNLDLDPSLDFGFFGFSSGRDSQRDSSASHGRDSHGGSHNHRSLPSGLQPKYWFSPSPSSAEHSRSVLSPSGSSSSSGGSPSIDGDEGPFPLVGLPPLCSRQQTVKTGLQSLLRAEFRNVFPLRAFRQDVVVWSFRRRLVSLWLNHRAEIDAPLPDLTHQAELSRLVLCFQSTEAPRMDLEGFASRMLADLGLFGVEIGNRDYLDLLNSTHARFDHNAAVFISSELISGIKLHLSENFLIFQLRAIKAQLKMEYMDAVPGAIKRLANAVQECLTKFYVLNDNELHAEILRLDADPNDDGVYPSLMSCDRAFLERVFSNRDLDRRMAIINELINLGPTFINIFRRHRLILIRIWAAKIRPRVAVRAPIHREVHNPRQLAGVGGPVRRRQRLQNNPRERLIGQLRERKFSKTVLDRAVLRVTGQQHIVDAYRGFLFTIKAHNNAFPDSQIKQFNILPTGRDSVSYMRLDVRNVRCLLGQPSKRGVTLDQVFDFEKIGINAADVASINTDGFGVSVTTEVRGPHKYPNVKSDFMKNEAANAPLTNVRHKIRGVAHLEEVEPVSLRERLNGARVISIDPGIKNPLVGWKWPDDDAGRIFDRQGQSFATVQEAHSSIKDPKVKNLTSSRWRTLTGEKEWTKKELFFRTEHNMTEVINALANGHNMEAYLTEYMRYFRRIFNYYSKPMLRKWRFRRYCLQQRAMASVHNEFSLDYEHGRIPKLDDQLRKQADKKYRRERRNQRPAPPAPVKAPVFAVEAPGFRNVRGNPPVPGRKFYKKFAREGLVVFIPKFNTTQACNRCHNRVEYEQQLSFYTSCNHRKKMMFTDVGRSHRLCKMKKKLHCELRDDDFWRSCFCPERARVYYDGRIGVCNNCQEGHRSYVERDVNAARNMGLVLFQYSETGERPEWNRVRFEH